VAVTDGERIPVERLRGVLTRLQGIEPAELAHVTGEDRVYVAAEMTAFLIAWLGGLACPVMNRPRAPSLAGPAWRWEQWLRTAAEAGLTVAAYRRDASYWAQADGISADRGPVDPPAPTAVVTIAAQQAIGAADPDLRQQARALACAAGTDLLRVHFNRTAGAFRLTSVDAWPDPNEPALSEALMQHWH
jgi:hypothetical protein